MVLTRGNWVLRLSIILNIVILLYAGRHITSKKDAVDFIEGLQVSGRKLASIGASQLPVQPASSGSNSAAPKFVILEIARGQSNTEAKQSPTVPGSDFASSYVISTNNPTEQSLVPTSEEWILVDFRDVKISQQMPELQNVNGTLKNLEDIVKCHDKSTEQRTFQRIGFWLIYNYVPVIRNFQCHVSVIHCVPLTLNILS
jgi:hypothetical protein